MFPFYCNLQRIKLGKDKIFKFSKMSKDRVIFIVKESGEKALLGSLLFLHVLISFVYKKAVLRAFHICFYLRNNLCEVTTRKNKSKKYFFTQRMVFNVRFWYTKKIDLDLV